MKVGTDHQEIIGISEAMVGQLITPPPDGVGVCPRCRSWTAGHARDGRAPLCENCIEIRAALGAEPLRLSTTSLYRKPSELRDWLTRYKGREDEDDPFDPDCLAKVRAILGRTLIEHGSRIEAAAGHLDGVVVVPSTSRPAPHPLAQLILSLELDLDVLPLLERGQGELGFRKPSREGYRALEHPPARVLLIDDVYTTGARLNSAAFALSRSGHKVAGALVLARRINPAYSAAAEDLWNRMAAQTYDWRDSPWI